MRLSGVLRSLRVCTAPWRHAVTCIFPRSLPPTRICFLLCCQVAPLPSVDPLHFGDLPPRLPWEPTTLFRAWAPATPQHTTDSSMCQGNPLTLSPSLSICPCPSLTHFPLPFSPTQSLTSYAVACFPTICLTYTVMALSITVTTSVCGISRMSEQCSGWLTWAKTRDTCWASLHTHKNKTLTTWS